MKTSFNGGILGDGMRLRLDMDVYARGLLECENFAVEPMGGVTRRNGMQFMAEALSADSVVFPYVYSTNISLFVEVGNACMRVYSPDGYVLANVEGSPWSVGDLRMLRVTQLKKALFFTHQNHHPREFAPMDGTLKEWALYPVEIAAEPRFTHDLQDEELIVDFTSATVGVVTFPQQYSIDTANNDVLLVTQTVAAQEYIIPRAEGYYPSAQGVLVGGKWQLYVSGKRGIKLTVQRRYKDGDWHDVGISKSSSGEGSMSNKALAGDEAGNECYMRVLSEDIIGTWSGYEQLFIINSWTRELRLKITHLPYNAVYTFDIPFVRPPVGAPWTFLDIGKKLKLSMLIDGVIHEETATILDSFSTRSIRFTIAQGLVAELFYHTPAVITAYDDSDELISGNVYWLESDTLIRKNMPRHFKLYWDNKWHDKRYDSSHPDNHEYYRIGYNAFYCIYYIENSSDIINPTTIPVYEGLPWRMVSGGPYYPGNTYACEVLNDIKDSVTGGLIIKTKDYSWSAWSAKHGYPAHALVFQQRLVFAATPAQPQTLWFSHTDDVSRFDPVVDMDDAGIIATLSSSNESGICWILGKGQDLCVGTQMGEYVVSAGGNGGAITAANIIAYSDSYVGASDVAPAVASSDMVVYIERGAQRLRQLGYSDQSNGYVSADLTAFCPELIEDGGGCVSLCSSRKPDPTIYAVLSNGTMACCSYNPLQGVSAFYLYSSPRATIKSVVAIPQAHGGDWLILRSTRKSPDGTRTKHCLEVMHDETGYLDTDIADDGSMCQQRYESTLLTMDMSGWRTLGKTTLNGEMHLFMRDAVAAESVMISCSGGDIWAGLMQAELPRAWTKVHATPSQNDRREYGVKVSSDKNFRLLGLNITNI